jgi:hypothetical protein
VGYTGLLYLFCCKNKNMKKSLWILFTLVVVATTTYVFAGTALLNTCNKGTSPADSIFLKTHWKQMGGFEKATPDHMRLGCWSTALAQIAYYHRLQPFGRVAYTSRKGYIIHEELDSLRVNFDLLTSQIDSTTAEAAINALARYNYAAALAVNKDFGTDNYMNKLAPASLLEAHYHIKANRYISWHGLLPYTTGKQEAVIRKEIHYGRPLFLHFANLKDFGHSVVIDGYKTVGKHFLVHLNQGQGGPQDGWYDFGHQLLKKDDRKLRVIYTICPLVK